jgi:hypothetical protein
MYNVGRAKYVINFHDGISTHKDGSAFYGIYIFRNKRKFNAKILEMRRDGFIERPFDPMR